jgi:hypothetical protein
MMEKRGIIFAKTAQKTGATPLKKSTIPSGNCGKLLGRP